MHGRILPEIEFYRIWREAVPRGVEFGEDLSQAGELQWMRREKVSAESTFDRLNFLVK